MTFWHRDEWFKNQPNDLWKEQCPFCDISLTPLVKEFTFWYLCNNKYPYWWNQKNLLLIPKRHIQYSYQLEVTELKELKEINKSIHKYFWDDDFFSFMRESWASRSLEHLHYHFLPGIITNEDVEHILEKK